ncbi:MAG: RNA polymerase sigma-54 factor [Clostridia bacterium]|nr:RNA polymerase sigma-54 factor [Clostridia bacterium]
MEIRLTKEQRQILGQKMCQSMQMLQMAEPELAQYLSGLSMENPLLEAVPSAEPYAPPMAEIRAGRPDSSMNFFQNHTEEGDSLGEYLQEQIPFLKADRHTERALHFLAACLDERGYLSPEPKDALDHWEAGLYERALTLLQSLEPPGVGARSLGECLCIQLRRMDVQEKLPYLLAEKYMDRLGRGHGNYVAKELGISKAQIEEAMTLLRRLNPKPGNGFCGKGDIRFCVPDITVSEGENGLELTTAERYMPSFRVSAYYAAMLNKDILSQEERAYFSQKLLQAQWVVECVERRRRTLEACGRIILEAQAPFIADGRSAITPFSMQDAARRMGVHPSTVSRAVRDKYLECRWGLYPLSAFFAQGVGKEGKQESRPEALSRMRCLVEREDKAHPLSDQALSEALAREGLSLSRRTVAKYREEAGIPAASARRRRT